MQVAEQTHKVMSTIVEIMTPRLNEKDRRVLYSCMAYALGYGGMTYVQGLTGMSLVTLTAGIKEIKSPDNESSESDDTEKKRIRKPGGGRKKKQDLEPKIVTTVEEIVHDSTYGDPTRVLLWTTLSLRKISELLMEKLGIEVGKNIVAKMLEELGYSRQQNQKLEGSNDQHVDRDAQFEYINRSCARALERNIPVISVDTKKKENLGNFKNAGSEYRLKGDPRSTSDHDFLNTELGKVAPYGVYVLNDNTAFVNLGSSSDTAQFAVDSIKRWWYTIGVNTFPDAKQLMITCDSGGSNSSTNRLWKASLQKFSNASGLAIKVCHFPPGCSKWNRIEHRLFCYITKSWQGKPLVDIETVVNLIGHTTTTKGLKVVCKYDGGKIYRKGIKVDQEVMDNLRIKFGGPHPQWNYIIRPQKS